MTQHRQVDPLEPYIILYFFVGFIGFFPILLLRVFDIVSYEVAVYLIYVLILWPIPVFPLYIIFNVFKLLLN